MSVKPNRSDRVSIKKQVRKNRIINLLRENGAMSRFDMSKAVDYSPPVVAQIVDELIKEGMVRESGKGDSVGGRRPILVEISPEAGFIIGIDIGASQTVALLMDLNSNVMNEITAPSVLRDDPELIGSELEAVINKLTVDFSFALEKLTSIGLAYPGFIDLDSELTNSGKRPQSIIVEHLNQKYGAPIYIDNDARLMALAEKWFGNGRQYGNFLSVNLGFGIGCGLVLNNEIYRGSFGHAGELGYVIVEPNSDKEKYGVTGCLESLAGGAAIGQLGIEYLKSNPESKLAKIVEGDSSKVEAKTIAEAARQGDEGCKEIYKKFSVHTGRAIASVVNLLDPEVVFLGGRIANSTDVFLKDLENEIRSQVLNIAEVNFRLEVSELKDSSAALGACANVIEQVFWSSYDEVVKLV